MTREASLPAKPRIEISRRLRGRRACRLITYLLLLSLQRRVYRRRLKATYECHDKTAMKKSLFHAAAMTR